MFRRERRPLRPNWWTILPLIANAALWAGIVYVCVGAKTMMENRAKTTTYAAASGKTEASSRKQSGEMDCPRPECAAPQARGAAATPTR